MNNWVLTVGPIIMTFPREGMIEDDFVKALNMLASIGIRGKSGVYISMDESTSQEVLLDKAIKALKDYKQKTHSCPNIQDFINKNLA